MKIELGTYLLLIGFIFAIVLPHVTHSQSLPVIPGASLLLTGFDVVKGESSYFPLFQWTYAKNKTWTNPQFWNLEYSLPDQIYLTNSPFTQQSSYATIFNSVVDSQQYQSESIGIGISEFKLGMNAESKVSYSVRKTFKNNRFAASTRLKTGIYYQSLLGNMRSFLDPDFVNEMQKLPTTRSSPKEIATYRLFLERFGTHYSYKILFGGIVEMSTQMDYSVSKMFTDTELQQQLNMQFSILSGNITSNSGSSHLSSSFTSNSISSIYLRGGNTSDYNPAQWNEWIHTVYFDPIDLSSSLQEISFLASNSAVAKNLENAISDYILEAALQWCSEDMCNGHGECTSNGTNNPFQSCSCNPGLGGSNCTVLEDTGIDYKLGPIGYNCNGISETSFELVASPIDYIVNLTAHCYNNAYIQAITLTFNNGSEYNTCSVSTSSKMSSHTFVFDKSDPFTKIAYTQSSPTGCGGLGTPSLYITSLSLNSRNSTNSPFCGSGNYPKFEIPIGYDIVGINGEYYVLSNVYTINSLGFVYRKQN